MELAEESYRSRRWEDDLDQHFALGWDIHVKVLFGETDIMQGP